ncbi:MAG: hypothetical protein HZB17_06635, partial [Chloroflexi bacterium]|nr:hypothetical protein [Chloroflexota bacterium]
VIALSYALTITIPAPQVARAASLAPGTEGLLKQTAIHLSKMEGGVSIGGFPGFEPPDDEKYKQKIKNKYYSARDVNDWVKEINNFLKQIIEKNPGMTLEEILTKQGVTPTQIGEFMKALRNLKITVEGMDGYGVDPARAKLFVELLLKLGVTAW